MPNWAFGEVEVTGTKRAIISFSERFISKDEPKTIPGKRYFGRSYHDDYRNHVLSGIEVEFKSKAPEERATVTLSVSFAWSADSCLISRYPKTDPDNCISLQDACMEDQVDVHIHTYLFDEGFEEDINCTASGELEHDGYDMIRAKCRSCGEEQSVARDEDLSEAVCCECGELGLERLKEDE